jgi:tetratricopeptide (TPR) repeat protein
MLLIRLPIIISVLTFPLFAVHSFLAPWAMAGDKGGPISKIVTVIQKSKADAEKQIIALHGQSKFNLLKQKILQKYPLNKVPLAKGGDPCPAVGFASEDEGPVIHARILNQAGAYYVTGVGAFLNGHPEIAKWGFSISASMVPNCPAYLSNLAFILNEQGDFKNAVFLLEYAKKLDPSDSSIYVNLAFSYQNLKKYGDAISNLLVAIALNPNVKNYQQMLLEIQKMRDEPSGPPISLTKQEKKAPKSPQLDEALKLLEAEKPRDFDEELSSSFQAPPPHGVEAKTRIHYKGKLRPRPFYSLEPETFGENRSDCEFFCGKVGLLERMGDEAVRGAGFKPAGGNPVEKFIGTANDLIGHSKKNLGTISAPGFKPQRTWKNVKEASRGAGLVMALLFYGYAGEIYEECCLSGADLGYAEAERLIDEAKREAQEKVKAFLDEMSKPEKFGLPVCVDGIAGSYCVSQGEKGTKKFEISASSGTIEFRIVTMTVLSQPVVQQE